MEHTGNGSNSGRLNTEKPPSTSAKHWNVSCFAASKMRKKGKPPGP